MAELRLQTLQAIGLHKIIILFPGVQLTPLCTQLVCGKLHFDQTLLLVSLTAFDEAY